MGWICPAPVLTASFTRRISSPDRVFQILARSRAEIERSVTNVRDATDWGNKLVQKIYTNPFVLESFL